MLYSLYIAFINADLSPAAARLAFEARERRQHRSQQNYSARVLVNSGAEATLLRHAAEAADCINNGSANTANTSNQVTLYTRCSIG